MTEYEQQATIRRKNFDDQQNKTKQRMKEAIEKLKKAYNFPNTDEKHKKEILKREQYFKDILERQEKLFKEKENKFKTEYEQQHKQ